MALRAESQRRGQPVLIDVDYRFHHTNKGGRYVATHQTPTTDITGAVSFDATTPTFLLRQAASATRLVINSIVLSQVGTVAGAGIGIVVIGDSVDRLSGTTGTLVVPQNLNLGSTNTSNATFRTGATAIAAAGGSDRVLYNRTVDADVGTISIIDSSDELIIPVTGSLLIYTFAGTTGPSWKFEVNWSEIE